MKRQLQLKQLMDDSLKNLLVDEKMSESKEEEKKQEENVAENI